MKVKVYYTTFKDIEVRLSKKLSICMFTKIVNEISVLFSHLCSYVVMPNS